MVYFCDQKAVDLGGLCIVVDGIEDSAVQLPQIPGLQHEIRNHPLVILVREKG
jgi:hypothetical protein